MRDRPKPPYEPHRPPGLHERLDRNVKKFEASFFRISTPDIELKRATIWAVGDELFWGDYHEQANRDYTNFVLDMPSISDGTMTSLNCGLFGKLMFNRYVGPKVRHNLSEVLVWARDKVWHGENCHNEVQVVLHFGVVARCITESLRQWKETGSLN